MATGIDRMHLPFIFWLEVTAPCGGSRKGRSARLDRTACHLACLLALLASGGRGADPAAGKTGGLVPGSGAARTGLTREELIREWDLDGDGTISKPEADVARGRMRRKRLDMQLEGGINPLTGLPRSIDPADTAADAGPEDEPVFRLPVDLTPPPEPNQQPEAALPGMRAPAVTVPRRAGGPTMPAGPTSATMPPLPSDGAGVQPPSRSGRASWLPPQRLPPAMTGGVRAGAPAAVPGYGAGPWSDLNAGRRPAMQRPADNQTPNGRPAAAGTATGGLLPSNRPPGRTGALIIPNPLGQPRGLGQPPRSVTPTPPLVPQPRITAEEIGGYRP
jgi:hypothetical protein